jgi:hypothetical protein
MMADVTRQIKTCQYCDAIMGCPHLRGQDGQFVPEAVITELNFRECPDWTTVGTLQRETRDKMYSYCGGGYLKALFELPGVALSSLRQTEKEIEEMEQRQIDETPDFFSMIVQGMPSSERENQLRYEDEVVIDENGNDVLRARPDFQLKRYASDPNGPVKLDALQILYWDINQVISEILKAEIALGYLTKDKKPKMPAVTLAEPEPQQENVEMPAAKRVRVTSQTSSPAPAQAQAPAQPAAAAAPGQPGPVRARVFGRPPPPAAAPAPAPAQAPAPAPAGLPPPVQGARPPMVGVQTGRVARAPVRGGGGPIQGPPQTMAAPAPAPTQEAGPSFDMQVFNNAVSIMDQKLDALHAKFDALLAKAETFVTKEFATDLATLQTDVATQTHGTFQTPKTQIVRDAGGNETEEQLMDAENNPMVDDMPLLFNHPDKIWAYIKGTAYDQVPQAGE